MSDFEVKAKLEAPTINKCKSQTRKRFKQEIQYSTAELYTV
jgi:hypothetical protein